MCWPSISSKSLGKGSTASSGRFCGEQSVGNAQAFGLCIVELTLSFRRTNQLQSESDALLVRHTRHGL